MAARFSPGPRFSLLDLFALVAGATAATAAGSVAWWAGLAVAIPLTHFFLFCNVFRVSRPPELLWAAVFIAFAAPTAVWGVPGWWPTAVGASGVAALVIASEMCKPSYHGLAWRWINPGLPAWWEARTAGTADAARDRTWGTRSLGRWTER